MDIGWRTFAFMIPVIFLMFVCIFLGLVKIETTLSDWMMIVFTAFLSIFAAITIDEGRKDRRKDSLEKQLVNLYSPLYAMFQRAKFGVDDSRNDVRNLPTSSDIPKSFVLDDREVDRIRQVLERYGHYLEPSEREYLFRSLDMGERESIMPKARPYFRYRDIDLRPHYDFVMDRLKKMKKELDDLTRNG